MLEIGRYLSRRRYSTHSMLEGIRPRATDTAQLMKNSEKKKDIIKRGGEKNDPRYEGSSLGIATGIKPRAAESGLPLPVSKSRHFSRALALFLIFLISLIFL